MDLWKIQHGGKTFYILKLDEKELDIYRLEHQLTNAVGEPRPRLYHTRSI